MNDYIVMRDMRWPDLKPRARNIPYSYVFESTSLSMSEYSNCPESTAKKTIITVKTENRKSSIVEVDLKFFMSGAPMVALDSKDMEFCIIAALLLIIYSISSYFCTYILAWFCKTPSISYAKSQAVYPLSFTFYFICISLALSFRYSSKSVRLMGLIACSTRSKT